MDKRMIAILIAAVMIVAGLSLYAAYLPHNSTQPSSASIHEIKIVDAAGNTFYFFKPVTRIVSLDPSATATLYAIGAYKYLVGGNEFDSYPPNETLPNLGNAYGVNYEELVNLSPQVVLGYGATVPSYGQYINNTLKIPFILDNPNSFKQIESETLMLGNLTGCYHNATLVVNWMQESLGIMENSTANITPSQEKTVFYFLDNYGGDWTAGNNTFFQDYFNVAHLKNIATQSGYYTINPEVVANSSPDIILLDQYVPESAVNVAPFNETNAYLSSPQQIYTVFNDNFFDEPDFRVIYAVAWLIEITSNPLIMHYLPSFPINLAYPPTTGW
ncbi:MAG: ABC transporter substrate-binding protein [Candidatus Thermoplasmatota archaeon]|nr:ABC transporter substrate-binding protein [Candidatus Thermoplasmatota archaeon]MCL5730910.1 ABC transporter substrate-binding protein [Candidatus Thermoplasmatota archaeon]